MCLSLKFQGKHRFQIGQRIISNVITVNTFIEGKNEYRSISVLFQLLTMTLQKTLLLSGKKQELNKK